MKPAKPASLFFDMDGTLVDSEPIHYRAYGALLAEYNISFPETLFHSFVGKSTLTNIQWIKQYYLLKEDETVLAAKKKEYFTSFLNTVTLFPHVQSLLTQAAQKYPLVVITSTKSNLTHIILEITHLTSFFSHIVTGDEGKAKPDPSLYNVGLTKMSIPPENVVAFEDSLSGYMAASSASIHCICIPNKYTKEQFASSHSSHYTVPIVPTLEEALRDYL